MVTPDADTRLLYAGLVGLVALERLVELVVSTRNSRRLAARGAIEVGREHYRAMVAVHATFLLACPLEVVVLDRPFLPVLAVPMLLLLAGTMALRYWVVATLGGRWCTRVICLPGAALVEAGPYRWLRHPNYVAVVIELAALPLIHTAWLTAIVFGIANASVLRVRLRVENEALQRFSAGPAGARA
jgi:methyltransferase